MTKRELIERLAACSDDEEISVAMFEETHIDGDNEARFRCTGLYGIDAIGLFRNATRLCINHDRRLFLPTDEDPEADVPVPSSIVRELNEM
jgi:hypothetical protein